MLHNGTVHVWSESSKFILENYFTIWHLLCLSSVYPMVLPISVIPHFIQCNTEPVLKLFDHTVPCFRMRSSGRCSGRGRGWSSGTDTGSTARSSTRMWTRRLKRYFSCLLFFIANFLPGLNLSSFFWVAFEQRLLLNCHFEKLSWSRDVKLKLSP